MYYYYHSTIDFRIPTYNNKSWQQSFNGEEPLHVDIKENDIFTLVSLDEDAGSLIIHFVENASHKRIYNEYTGLSLEFMKANSKLFIEITQQMYRDSKIDKLLT